MSKIIMGIQLEQRSGVALEVQKILTEYGCFIKTRLGLHQASENKQACSEKGIILLEFINNGEKEAAEAEQKLQALEGVIVRKMEF